MIMGIHVPFADSRTYAAICQEESYLSDESKTETTSEKR